MKHSKTDACCGSFAALEVGPQPHGVLRADIYNYMKEAIELAIEWVSLFNSGTKLSCIISCHMYRFVYKGMVQVCEISLSFCDFNNGHRT